MNVFRVDRGTIEKFTDNNGFLKARVTIARTGVFPYLRSDGTLVREAKLPEELLRPEVISGIKGLPVTDGHPPVIVTPENVKEYMKGTVLLADSRDSYIIGEEVIHDKSLIDSIKSGEKKEVSIGFKCDIDNVEGEFNGERYDSVQRNIRINHLAHVQKGRAGETVRIWLDNSENIGVQINEGENSMNVTFRCDDGKDYQIPIAVKNQMDKQSTQIKKDEGEIEALQAQIDSMSADIANKNSELAKMDESQRKTEIVALQAKVSALQTLVDQYKVELEKATSPEAIEGEVAERQELAGNVSAVDSTAKIDGLSKDEMKKIVIQKSNLISDKVKLDSMDAVELDAYYKASVDLIKTKAMQSTTSRNDAHSGKTADEIRKDVEDMKAKRLNMNKGGK